MSRNHKKSHARPKPRKFCDPDVCNCCQYIGEGDFLCRASADCDHFTNLTLEQTARYQEQFYSPEMFWGMDGRIICLPREVD